MLSIPIINKSWVKEDEEKKREGGREGKGEGGRGKSMFYNY